MLRRHSNHVRLRHGDARDYRIQDVTAPDEIHHQPPDRNVISEDEEKKKNSRRVPTESLSSLVG